MLELQKHLWGHGTTFQADVRRDDHCTCKGMVRTAERGGRRGHCPGARGHRGTRGFELSGLECKIHQLKLRPAGAMMLFFDFGPKFEHPRTL